MIRADSIPYLKSRLFEGLPGIRHGFYTRIGGVSQSIYGSLNCSFGSNDHANAISENRDRVAANHGIVSGSLYTLKQVHGPRVVSADIEKPAPTIEGDALVSATPGNLVGVLTADCVPVLLADPGAGVVAAVHAGWRGAVGGVVAAAVQLMEARGARRASLVAAVGPAIRQSSYEVGVEVRDQVCRVANAETLFEPRDDRFLFDLPGFVVGLCRDVGIGQVDDLGNDTYADEDSFFSYRRSCHRNEADYGRQISVIGIAP